MLEHNRKQSKTFKPKVLLSHQTKFKDEKGMTFKKEIIFLENKNQSDFIVILMSTTYTTTKQVEAIVHTLSSPSKMPCHGYSTPASKCITGGKLRKVANSICSVCYALKGRYVFPNVLDAMEKRFQSIFKTDWVDAITFLISKKEKSGYFRWHDSGDLQGQWHLEKIVEVAKRLPHIKFWLPTREISIVGDYIRSGKIIPDNLTIRLSAFMLDGEPPIPAAKRLGLCVSGASATDFNCPAYSQDGKCGSCRNCWNKDVFQVNYKKH
jgi:hypothetical protein